MWLRQRWRWWIERRSLGLQGQVRPPGLKHPGTRPDDGAAERDPDAGTLAGVDRHRKERVRLLGHAAASLPLPALA